MPRYQYKRMLSIERTPGKGRPDNMRIGTPSAFATMNGILSQRLLLPSNHGMWRNQVCSCVLTGLIIYAVTHGAINIALNLGDYITGRHFMIVIVFAVLFYILIVPRSYWPIQTEVVMFGLWLLWCLGGAGDALLANPLAPEGFWAAYRWAVMTGLMLFISAGVTALHKSMTPSLRGIVTGCLILVCIAIYTGDYQETTHNVSHQFGQLTTGNANAFSYCLFLGIVAAAYFVSNSSGYMTGVLSVLALLVFTIGIVLSASRKALLGEGLFIILWLYFTYRHQGTPLRGNLFHKARAIVIPAVLIGTLYVSGTYIVGQAFGPEFRDMLIVKRFKEQTTLQHEEDRIDKYLEAPAMIRKKPVFGIGLGNFADRSRSGRPSHSDYVAVITETGIPGAILYFSVYVILWRRLSRVQARSTDPRTIRTIGILKASLISILCMAVGRWNYDDPATYALLGAAAGFSWSCDRIVSHAKDALVARASSP